MGRPKALAVWEERIGLHPRVVHVGERVRRDARTVYMRWWVEKPGQRGNWKWESLRMTVRDAKGKLVPALVQEAFARAQQQYERLGGVVVGEKPQRPVTLADTWAIITDPGTGRWPTRTVYRDELKAALQDATTVLGPHFCWMHFDEEPLRQVTRWKAQQIIARGRTGYRGAEIVGTRLLTIMAALRKRLPKGVVPPGGKEWRAELRTFVEALHKGRMPEPHRPRYTLEEFQQIMAATWTLDPRFGLLMSLGMGLRLGQVKRARRRDLDLEKGTFTVYGAGHKHGTVVELTPGQLADVRTQVSTGYLQVAELAFTEGRVTDYPLFPQGTLLGMRVADPAERRPAIAPKQIDALPLDKTTINAWWRKAEDLAGIAHVRGRGPYGARRLSVDVATEAAISEEALQELGGWSDVRTPSTIYRDKERPAARREAMRLRAAMRGENVPPAYPSTSTANQTEDTP